ncbi:glycosyltransferase [Enterobacter cloacae]|nr:glycosyltransferase [Enterobacter cloacae]
MEHNRMIYNKKLSIVVPCYNSSEFIAECLSSILPNLSAEMELIIINDGSTDNSADIIDDLTQNHRDKNITIIHQINSGLSSARNKGISMATGKYISFLDSDDIFHENFWLEILPILNDSSIDIVEFNADQFQGDVMNIVEHIDSSVFQGRIEISDIEQLTPAFRRSKWYPWARVYKTSLFTEYKIEFPTGRLYEDMSTIPSLYLHSKVIFGINKSFVWYRHHNKSITQTFRQKDLEDLVYVIRSLALLANNNAEIKKALFPTVQRTFNLIKYMLIKNKGANFPYSEQKALRLALLCFINHFKTSRKAQILILPLYLNTIVRLRKK